MRRSLARLAPITLAPAIVACGSTEPTEQGGEAAFSGVASAASSAGREVETAQDAVVAQATYNTCRASVDPLLDALETIDSRLSVGVNRATYSELLGGANVAYDQSIDAILESSPECVRAAAELEDAYNLHTQVLDECSDCIADYACDFNTGAINGRTQERWVRTSTLVEHADGILERSAP